jgi:hypothetical protein
MAEKFEITNGAAPKTEFERSIARSAATSNDPSSKAANKIPPAVDSLGSAPKPDRTSAADEQLQALRTELEHIKQSVATIATTATGLASEKVDVTMADLEEALKRNVFASIGIAALVGYVWGRTR